MRIFLVCKKIILSDPTVHKYINKELHLYPIVRKKIYYHDKGEAHKVFPNLINQEFSAEEINQKWCTDFIYLFLTDG
jgi:transposase InsO family protein